MKDQKTVDIDGHQFGYDFNTFSITHLSNLTETTPVDCIPALFLMGKKDVMQMVTFVIHAGIIGYQRGQGNFNEDIPISVVSRYAAKVNYDQFETLWAITQDTLGLEKISLKS